MLTARGATVASMPVCCYRPSNRLHLNPHRLCYSKTGIPNPLLPKIQTRCRHRFSFTLTATNSCSQEQGKTRSKKKKKKDPYPFENHAFLEEFHSFPDTSTHKNPAQKRKEEREGVEQENEGKETEGISTNMWWADLKAALGQRFNLEGVASSVSVVTRDRHLAIPHVAVPDIRYIDWGKLRNRGFKGVVFDKDNTITAPYCLTLFGPIAASIEQCKSVFGNDIAVFSNSAGLQQYDPDGRKARALEMGTGLRVLRHRIKKPSGTAEEIEDHFGCSSKLLVMVGDRHFTDVVYGNRNGFLTILTKPLSLEQEPFVVKQLRKLEVHLVNHWTQKGFKSTSHTLLPDVSQCVKDSCSP